VHVNVPATAAARLGGFLLRFDRIMRQNVGFSMETDCVACRRVLERGICCPAYRPAPGTPV